MRKKWCQLKLKLIPGSASRMYTVYGLFKKKQIICLICLSTEKS